MQKQLLGILNFCYALCNETCLKWAWSEEDSRELSGPPELFGPT